MVCSSCGKEIKDGATYCLECGAPIDEPVVITDVRKKIVEEITVTNIDGEEEKILVHKDMFLDFSGYVKDLGTNTSMLIGLLAGLLVYLSAFFSWVWIEQWGEKTSRNLFEIGGKNGDMALNETIIIVMAVLIILSSIDMIAFSACEYIGPLKRFCKMYWLRALPIVLTFIFFLIIINNEAYSFLIDSIKNQEEANVNLGEGYNFSGGMGAGPIILVIGQVIYGVSVYLEYVRGKNNGQQ